MTRSPDLDSGYCPAASGRRRRRPPAPDPAQSRGCRRSHPGDARQRGLEGRLVRHIVTDGDDVPSATERISAPKREPLPVLGAVSGKRSPALQPHPVDGKRLELDVTGTIDRHAEAARCGVCATQQPLTLTQAAPRSGGAMTSGARRSTCSAGPVIKRLSINVIRGASARQLIRDAVAEPLGDLAGRHCQRTLENAEFWTCR